MFPLQWVSSPGKLNTVTLPAQTIKLFSLLVVACHRPACCWASAGLRSWSPSAQPVGKIEECSRWLAECSEFRSGRIGSLHRIPISKRPATPVLSRVPDVSKRRRNVMAIPPALVSFINSFLQRITQSVCFLAELLDFVAAQ